MRNQLNADRTSGDADKRATSCCSEGARSGMSARGGVGLMGVIASSYNAWEGDGDWIVERGYQVVPKRKRVPSRSVILSVAIASRMRSDLGERDPCNTAAAAAWQGVLFTVRM